MLEGGWEEVGGNGVGWTGIDGIEDRIGVGEGLM